MTVVWTTNESGHVTLAEDHAAEAAITGGPAAPDEFSNDFGVRIISDADAAKALGITEDEAKEIREPADSGLSPVPSSDEPAEGDAHEATPAAEALADELGVDVDDVDGSGVDGRVLVSDVKEAAVQDGDAEGEADPEQ